MEERHGDRGSLGAVLATVAGLLLAATLPSAVLAEIGPTTCSSPPNNATLCFSGTHLNDAIIEQTTGSTPGGVSDSWSIYSNASITSAANYIRLIEVSATGAAGSSSSPNAGYAGTINIQNDGPLTWSAGVGAPVVFFVEATGGNGATPSNHEYGGLGGATGNLTVVNTGAIQIGTVALGGATALHVYGAGGNGGNADDGAINWYGGNGGGGTIINVTNSGAISLGTAGSALSGNALALAIDVRSQGGNAGSGSCSNTSFCPNGNPSFAGNGGNAGTVSVDNTAPLAIYWTPQAGSSSNVMAGIQAKSIGGAGAGSLNNYANGGIGGEGGSIWVTNRQNIILSSQGSIGATGAGILAQSVGGQGGTGNKQDSDGNGVAGAGGTTTRNMRVALPGGTTVDATAVVTQFGGIITTTGNDLTGINARVHGGNGGAGGSGYSDNNSNGGVGGAAGPALILLTNNGQVSTAGQSSVGLLAQSIGGLGGDGGTDGGLVGTNGGAGMGGASSGTGIAADAGTKVTTTGDFAFGIAVQTLGGGGGSGSDFVGVLGGAGGDGGRGGDACTGSSNCPAVVNTGIQSFGTVTTTGSYAYGLMAQSIGGGGGSGGISDGGIYSLGGDGGAGGSGSGIKVENGGTVITSGYGAHGILAQSIGGGGGAGGVSAGLLSIGGNGATNYTAFGGQVLVTQSGTVQTGGDAAYGLLVQSIGGGGGSGGGSVGIASVGGQGAAGGPGGAVTVDLTGAVSTAGQYSHGLVAQSIGGGGGSGGNVLDFSVAIPTVGIGGSSAGGGVGGDVGITFGGAVTTGGYHAGGLVAQSIGGGGGVGGDVVGVGLISIGTFTIGGAGSSGSAGGAVALSTLSGSTPTVRTAGAYGVGVLAQSIGGGGGNGGNASGFDASIDFAASVAVGGKAGGGGIGGGVTVNWQGGSITTGANMRALSTAPGQALPLTGQAGNAYGLVAQSIGGGGGNGGSATVDQFVFSLPTEVAEVPTLNLTSTIGGTGGAGGAGGNVSVTLNSAQIVTWGAGSHAILAQSIGGGGGTGGDSSSLSVSAAIPKTNDLPTFNLSYTMGGNGGTGGGANSSQPQTVAVTVGASTGTNTIITTYGDNANALVAQSIGGGGGDGGIGNAATFTLFEGTSARATMALGGKGSSGGDGGAVTVTLDGSVLLQTIGSGSRGVVAQSIGGGGGTSQGGTGGIGVGSFTGKVEVGRSGGGGGNGGAVAVTTGGGGIATQAKDADGILAQSIGGGGGLGGTFGSDGSWDNPNWINVVWDVQHVIKTLTDQGASYSMTATVGGAGGAGGNGGTVTIDSRDSIGTIGDWADGIVAQSIGGGGGVGGTAVADGSQQTASANVGVGGSGGASGVGGAITIQNAGLISTAGFSAYGLLAQSIGGGGGQGGDGSAKSTGRITVGGGVGGSGGGGGDGGTVQWMDTATVSQVITQGDSAHAVVLQSVGGGGGVGGSGNGQSAALFPNLGFDITVGGSGGVAGNGCAVTIGGATPNGNNCQVTATGTGATLLIETQGRGSYGLVAQSIGGGGGMGGASVASSLTTVAVGGTGGSSGNGSMVDLYLQGSSIRTSGYGAHGIVAQSIGGGGGIGGAASGTPLSYSAPNTNGSGSGNGGHVVVDISGQTVTTGDYAFGIVAQSIGGGGGLSGGAAGDFAGSNGGSGTSGYVTVTVNGLVSATGFNAIGILTQSVASGGSGTITVDVNGSVTGGSGQQGIGVQINGGDSNNAVNISQSGSVSALSGTAISASGIGATLVTNNGTVQGNVLLRNDIGTLGRLDNRGVVLAGALLDADVTNSGRLSVLHSSSAFATTRITGNFTQAAGGSTIIGADLTTGTADRLQIDGQAILGGRIAFNFRSLRPNRSAVVLTAAGGIMGQLTPDNGPGLFTFQLQQTADTVSVSAVGANLASPSFGLNASQTAIARGLQDIWNAGGGTLDTLFASLQGLAANGGYADALSKLSPGVALAPAARSRDNVQEFSNNLLSCPVFERDTALVGETECTWARIGGRLTNQSASGGIAGFNNSLMTYQLGTQWAIAPDWFLGGSIAYQQSWLSGSDGRVNTTGNGGSVGLALKRQSGPWLFAASVGGSLGWYDTKRLIAIPGFTSVAYGSSSVLSGQGRLRAAYSFVFQDWYVRPYADFDVIHVRTPGYSETGAGALGLTYETASQWTAAFSPTVEVGGRMNLANGYVLRPYASVGMSAFSNTEWTSTSRLQGGLGAGSFTTSMATDPVVARVSAGIQLMSQDRLDFRLTYDGAFSEHTVSNALSLRAALRF